LSAYAAEILSSVAYAHIARNVMRLWNWVLWCQVCNYSATTKWVGKLIT